MRTILFRIVCVLISLALLLANAPSPSTPGTFADIQAAESNSLYKLGEAVTPPATTTEPSRSPQLDQSFGKLPLYFVENQGQLDEQVVYYIQGSDKTIYFTAEGVTFALSDERPMTNDERPPTADHRPPLHDGRGARSEINNPQSEIQRWAVKLDFIGANPNVRPVGQDKTEAVISYFKGPQDQWRAGLPTYSRIVYPNLWPGIDLVYYGTVNQLKYEFVVQPGADPAQIRLAYRGADVALNEVGQLEISTPIGGFSDDTPVAYQEIDGQRVDVAVAYQISDLGSQISDAQSQAQEFGFRIGSDSQDPQSAIHNPQSYDPAYPLILDPAVLVYCGYIGGDGHDWGYGIAVDNAGNAYITGETISTEATFPVSVGPDLTHNGGYDAFVTKVNADGTGLIYAGYIGGSNGDTGYGIAVDNAGNAYITGFTASTEDSFPVSVGPDLTHNGSSDAFVAKVNVDGTGLIYAGYIGGSGSDRGYGIAVDNAGNAYITGYTVSTEDSFPVSVGPDLTFNGNAYDYDAFVAKVNVDGTGLTYAGYIGGYGYDTGYGIAVDNAGNAYITGNTNSTEDSFPVSVGPDLTYNGGDAFVAKVSVDGTGLIYAGYIGGSGGDVGYGIAVDNVGNAYITGSTSSTEASFPVSVGPDLTYNGGTIDAFVAKVSADGAGLIYAGYIGGSGQYYDYGHGIAVDNAGNAYITGYTDSTEGTFPVSIGPDLTYNGNTTDAFVAKVNADGTGLIYAGYIGGSGREFGHGIAVDNAGNAYITGSTSSTEASFPVSVGPDLTYNDNWDAFVAKVGAEGGCAPNKRPVLLIHGWGGPDIMSEDEMGFAQLSKWMEQDGYVEGCNLFYATGVHAENSREQNSAAIQSKLRDAYDLIAGWNPNWRGHFDIIGHSYGGLNARFYLESSHYDNHNPNDKADDVDYKQYGIHIDNLFTLGSPHGGAQIQELYPLSVVIAFPNVVDPQKWPSALQLLSWQMDTYNNSYEQSDGTCYRLVGGDFLQQSKVPLPWRILYSPFPRGDIGVSLRSSRWLGINASLYNNYPHVVYATTNDMHGYVPIGVLGLTDLRSYVNPASTYNDVISPYIGKSMGECHPSQSNRRSVENTLTQEPTTPPVLIASGSITGGQIVSGTMPVDWSGQTAFYVSWMSGDLDLTLRDPAGVVFTPSVALNDANADYGKALFGASGLATYIFTNTLTGQWAYTLTAASGPYPLAFELYVNPDSPLAAQAFAPAWLPLSAPALITASLFYSATPVSTASVQAHIARPDDAESSLALHDDGLAPDAAAGDGIYSNVYTDTTVGGFYYVQVEADGDYNGQAYHRSAQTVFPVAPDSASLRDAYADQPLDSNGDGLYEGLDVTVGLSATQLGDFTVSAVLQGAGEQYIDLANATLYSSTGMLTATLHFASQAIYNSGLDGPYTLTQVTLLDDAKLIKLDEVNDAWATAAYNHQQFRRPPFAVTLPISASSAHEFGDTCARLSFGDSATGTLTMVTVTLASTFPTTQTSNRPLPRRYDISGDGDGFTATLSLCYDDFDLTAAGIITESDLQLYRYEGGGQWQPFASSVNTATNVVTATGITAFSVWAIGAPVSNEPTAITLQRQTQRVLETLWVYAVIGALLMCFIVWRVRRARRYR